jgi:hypothetical protein
LRDEERDDKLSSSAILTDILWGMSKVMVSFPEELLAELDTEARRRSTSRSALLATAARRELARRDSEQVAAAIARSEQRFVSAGTFEAADLVRHDRDSRRPPT